jgi:ABC-type nickel/cobalt efflux system permease component RcnA
LVLVGGFSLGLASVLIVLGLIAVYARRWLERLPMADGWGQYLSLVSAIAVICIGIGLTAFSILSRSLSIHSEFLF